MGKPQRLNKSSSRRRPGSVLLFLEWIGPTFVRQQRPALAGMTGSLVQTFPDAPGSSTVPCSTPAGPATARRAEPSSGWSLPRRPDPVSFRVHREAVASTLGRRRIRSDAREAEGAPLLREYGVKSSIEGSNPSHSANGTDKPPIPAAFLCAQQQPRERASVSNHPSCRNPFQ